MGIKENFENLNKGKGGKGKKQFSTSLKNPPQHPCSNPPPPPFGLGQNGREEETESRIYRAHFRFPVEFVHSFLSEKEWSKTPTNDMKENERGTEKEQENNVRKVRTWEQTDTAVLRDKC